MEFRIKIPLIQTEADATFKKDLTTSVAPMVSNYGNLFKQASNYTKLPVQVLYSVAMVESRGQHYNESGNVIVTGGEKSTGIMQISPNMFYEIYMKEVREGRISEALKNKVRSFLNIDFTDKSLPQPATTSIKDKVAKALLSPEFNILASAIVLRRLLEESANTDMTMRLDKAIVKYNVGLYSSPTKTSQYKTGDTTALLTVVPSITQNYIKNIVGKNGAMYYLLLNKIS
jgi:hypothetical protein